MLKASVETKRTKGAVLVFDDDSSQRYIPDYRFKDFTNLQTGDIVILNKDRLYDILKEETEKRKKSNLDLFNKLKAGG